MRVEQGTLLAAWPDMLDPNFMHSVVLMCQHSEEGAYGLITNRETDHVVSDLLPDHPLLADSLFPVFLGGPVDHTAMQFLHCVPEAIPGGVALSDSIWLGGELDAMAEWLRDEPERALRSVRIFLGYSGWGAGQLDLELGLGSWIPATGSTETIFGTSGEEMWRRVVRSIGGAGEELQNQPPDISWN